ncbi:helix-turn-helix domain-containing protein [uncultured Chryseobacterium sp.]|uniref:helix-turn-helix domain-containing protein n=1 Tax=uncultured Chryseobacterium sp. TaxID=259322 RepID=UPI0025D0F27E|nr:helix-turn-helix domain-containing protein [uncultured Chryseobacterium sp.]
MKKPNYRKIYTDMIMAKFPDKMDSCSTIINKESLSSIDIISLQKKLFDTQQRELTEKFNQQHKSYDIPTIHKILQYQRDQQLNNSQLARHFKLSRNTVTKWKKFFS